ncbi:MAG: nickel/cobalt transporter [Neorhizobium sp.]|nr:nickel/cobalt transporter [Neorhizobium sp.]
MTGRTRLPRRAATLALAAVAALTIFLPLAGSAFAQSPLGVGTAEPSFSIGGPFGPFLAWINVNQQAFYRALTGALRALRADPWALTGLIGLSFAYGVFHAAGPGHGKAVISSYMIANEVELKRGIAISFISSLLQGLVAVLVVAVAWFLLRGTGITLTQATTSMEIASFALVVAFGAWLLVRKIRAMIRPRPQSATAAASSSPARAMSVSAPAEPLVAGAGTVALGARAGAMTTKRGPSALGFKAVEIADHEATGQDGTCETCGVTHMPDPQMLRAKEFNLKEAWSAIVAVGLRPCSGAILVMTFSTLNGLYAGGILSVLAMSIGTAITVTILATIAVAAKDLAMRLSGPGSRFSRRVGDLIEIGGALFVMLVGLALLGASLQA